MELADILNRIDVEAVPLVHLVNQPIVLFDHKIHHRTEGKLISRSLLVRQVVEKSPLVDCTNAVSSKTFGRCAFV